MTCFNDCVVLLLKPVEVFIYLYLFCFVHLVLVSVLYKGDTFTKAKKLRKSTKQFILKLFSSVSLRIRWWQIMAKLDLKDQLKVFELTSLHKLFLNVSWWFLWNRQTCVFMIADCVGLFILKVNVLTSPQDKYHLWESH